MTSNTGLDFFVLQQIRHYLFSHFAATIENGVAHLLTKNISDTRMSFHLQALVWSGYQQ
jgi:hypothetical protein